MKRDQITGIVLLILGCLVVILARQIPKPNLANDVGPRLVPYISGIGIILCSIGIFTQAKEDSKKPYFTTAGWRRFAAISFVIIIYAISLVTLGFLISTPIIIFAAIQVMGQFKNPFLKSSLVAIGFTAFIYIIFEKVLNVMLPTCIFF